MPVFKDLTGRNFTRLTVIKKYGLNKHNKITWLCRCECGTEKVVLGASLMNGKTKSCGCLQKEKVIEKNYSHGKSYTRLYRIWRNMKSRCTVINNPDYKNYGGRGISICNEWIDDFQSFYNWAISNGYSDVLSIDRINVNKGYSPQNCRWSTDKDQARNKRNNVNTLIDGEYLSIAAIAEKYQVSREAVRERFKNGYRGLDLVKGLIKKVVTVKPESISYSVEI